MKLPTAIKTPSGKWKIQVMVNGHRKAETFLSERDAIAWAASVKARAKELEKSVLDLTLKEAFSRHIASKENILSPSTIAGYQRIAKNAFPELMGKRIDSLTQEDVQRAVNRMSKDHSAKSVANAHGLLASVLSVYRPSFVLRTTLPQKDPNKVQIPTQQEIAALMLASRGTRMELPVWLAVWMGLRVSEIRGLTWDCIEDGRLHVKAAVVEGVNGPAFKKTKTVSGDRFIPIPKEIMEIINRTPKTDSFLCHMSGQAIYKAFVRLCEKAGTRRYRFHDLRHASASVNMMVGMPNTYNQKRMGHKTDYMLKNVYLHTFDDVEARFSGLVDDYYRKILQLNLQPET
jgi:integrase